MYSLFTQLQHVPVRVYERNKTRLLPIIVSGWIFARFPWDFVLSVKKRGYVWKQVIVVLRRAVGWRRVASRARPKGSDGDLQCDKTFAVPIIPQLGNTVTFGHNIEKLSSVRTKLFIGRHIRQYF